MPETIAEILDKFAEVIYKLPQGEPGNLYYQKRALAEMQIKYLTGKNLHHHLVRELEKLDWSDRTNNLMMEVIKASRRVSGMEK